jgi:hypothetical protein
VYLQSATITSLSISGRKSQCLGRFFACVGAALAITSGLEFLDISGSHCSNEGIPSIVRLMRAGNLKVFDFDGISPSSPSLFFELLAVARTLPHTKVSYPAVDIKTLASGAPSTSDYSAHFATRVPGDSGRPFFFFKLRPPREFPPLWEDEEMAMPIDSRGPPGPL